MFSIRATAGQNLWAFTQRGGEGGLARGGTADPTGDAVTACIVWGACFRELFARSMRLSSTARISSRIAITASQKRSSSALGSLSVGSIISVPATRNNARSPAAVRDAEGLVQVLEAREGCGDRSRP